MKDKYLNMCLFVFYFYAYLKARRTVKPMVVDIKVLIHFSSQQKLYVNFNLHSQVLLFINRNS